MQSFAETVTLTDEQAATAVAGGIFGSLITFGIIFYILIVIAGWKIFEKASEAGWKSLIPIYNCYLLYKIVGMQNWFWITVATSLVCSCIFTLNDFNPDMTTEQLQAYDFSAHVWVVIALLVSIIVNVVANVKHAFCMGKAFGKSTGFIIAMLLFPNICWLILGFGKDKFNKKALKD